MEKWEGSADESGGWTADGGSGIEVGVWANGGPVGERRDAERYTAIEGPAEASGVEREGQDGI